jgi:hypothetical protein
LIVTTFSDKTCATIPPAERSGLPAPIADQVIDFYYALFEHIFAAPFRSQITERLRRDAVIRQVQEAAGAASQSLTRFSLNQRLSEQQTTAILAGFTTLYDQLKIDDVANPNSTFRAPSSYIGASSTV